jgi:hypothetical protein
MAQDRLETERDEAEERAKNAEHDRAAAVLVAEELARQAGERKARGRWRRAWDGWRGW